jgi:hypothetical protein
MMRGQTAGRDTGRSEQPRSRRRGGLGGLLGRVVGQ